MMFEDQQLLVDVADSSLEARWGGLDGIMAAKRPRGGLVTG
jgi:hypothetical protein